MGAPHKHAQVQYLVFEKWLTWQEIVRIFGGAPRTLNHRYHAGWQWEDILFNRTRTPKLPLIIGERNDRRQCNDASVIIGRTVNERTVLRITPGQTHKGMNTLVDWECVEGHIGTNRWGALLGGGCRSCGRQKQWAKYRSDQLGKIYGTYRIVKYVDGLATAICDVCGHEYTAILNSVVKSKGCSQCRDRKHIGEKHHDRTITDVTGKDTQRVYTWLCDAGHEGEAHLQLIQRNGCYLCSTSKALQEPVGKTFGTRKITECLSSAEEQLDSTRPHVPAQYKFICLQCGAEHIGVLARIKKYGNKPCQVCRFPSLKSPVGKTYHDRTVTAVTLDPTSRRKTVYAWVCAKGHRGSCYLPALRNNGCCLCSGAHQGPKKPKVAPSLKRHIGETHHARTITGVVPKPTSRRQTMFTWVCAKGHRGSCQRVALLKAGCRRCSHEV